MKLKQLLSAALSAALLGSAALAADVTAPGSGPAADYEISARGRVPPVRVWGSASELGENTVRLRSDDSAAPYGDIIINITGDTMILDAVTGETKTFADLKEGETLYAYVSAAMTRSQPPISNAELVLCGVPADYAAPTYAEVEGVKTGEAGNMSVLMSGGVVLHLNKDTALSAYGTKNIPALEDIVPGVRLLSWYSAVALSLPAQASPGKVLVFPSAYGGYVSAAPGVLSLNGRALTLPEGAQPFAENGKLMLPVRALAEAVGCAVDWNAAEGGITVKKDGKTLYFITIGGGSMALEDDLFMNVVTPAVNRGGVTFLAADDLLWLHSLKLASADVPF